MSCACLIARNCLTLQYTSGSKLGNISLSLSSLYSAFGTRQGFCSSIRLSTIVFLIRPCFWISGLAQPFTRFSHEPFHLKRGLLHPKPHRSTCRSQVFLAQNGLFSVWYVQPNYGGLGPLRSSTTNMKGFSLSNPSTGPESIYVPKIHLICAHNYTHRHAYEPLSKLLVSPFMTPIVVPYIIPYITPFKEFRL